MSVNKYQPHVLVLPEDDANRQLANGFLLDQFLLTRKIRVLQEVGGWNNVLARFKFDHIENMERYPHRFMVLLIDFDGELDRLETARAAKDCREETYTTWQHDLLRHNASELDRLRHNVRPILF